MPDDDFVTRREVDLLRQAGDAEHSKMWQRLDAMDTHGSRGVGALTVRMDDLIRDVSELKSEVTSSASRLQADVDSRFETHGRIHQRELDERKADHKFRFTSLISVIVALLAVVSVIVSLLTLH